MRFHVFTSKMCRVDYSLAPDDVLNTELPFATTTLAFVPLYFGSIGPSNDL